MSFVSRISTRLHLASRMVWNRGRPLGKNKRVIAKNEGLLPLRQPGYTGYSWLTLIPIVNALWGFGKKEEEAESSIENTPKELSLEEKVIKQADELYAQNDIFKLYDLLIEYKDLCNDEVLWRLARAACDKGKMTADKEIRRQLTYEAFEFVKQALELNDDSFAAHKWFAILLDYVGEYEGTKQRISNAYKVKEHFLKAIKLNPTDATTIYGLGYWCFLFAELPWIQQKVASVIFTTPPSSTYEEALKYFLEAEQVDPNFYSMNLLMLGKTYMRLKDERAIGYLQRARNYPVSTADDQLAHKEAIELLKKLGCENRI